jgi:hypothetical protein
MDDNTMDKTGKKKSVWGSSIKIGLSYDPAIPQVGI